MNDVKIRKATSRDLAAVDAGYIELMLHEQTHCRYTIWEQGIYPTIHTAKKSLEEDSLYVAEIEGKLYASMIANQTQPAEYQAISWLNTIPPDEVFVIHLLCVRPSVAGKGIGTAMIRYAMERAKNNGCKVLRLDTGGQNIPAYSLYKKLGFRLAGSSTMAVGGKILHENHLFLEYTL